VIAGEYSGNERPRRASGARWRRKIARLHMWLGAVAAAYILFVSVSGGALVFERELHEFFSPRPEIASGQGTVLSTDALERAAARDYPQARVIDVWTKKLSVVWIAEIWLETDGIISRRLYHPYTGADLGDAEPFPLHVLAALRNAHLHVMAGNAGRLVNGAGGLALLALAVTGIATWRRRPSVPREVRSKYRLFFFHRAAGLLSCAFAALWGLTGACLALPNIVSALSGSSGNAQSIFRLMYRLHAGSGGGWPVKTAWAMAALALASLAVSGLMIWIRRYRTTSVPAWRLPQTGTASALASFEVAQSEATP
jgi:uncharacterized iron-regulated membrane protein